MKSVVTIRDNFEDEVTGNELKYLIKLGRHLCNVTRLAWPSTSTLAELTKLSVKTIYNITKELERKKIIEVRRAKINGRNKVNQYRLATKKIRFGTDEVGTEFMDEEYDQISSVKITDGGGVKITDELSTSKEVHVHYDVKKEFDAIWDVYGKKKNRAKSFTAFKNLTKKERKACASAIPAYVKSTPDVQFRALLSTYIHGKRWNDELEGTSQPEAPDTKLNAGWEDSYQRFTAALTEAMGEKANLVSPLTRSEYVAWSTHQRRKLTGRLNKKNFHTTVLRWTKENIESVNTYVLKQEIKTADAFLWYAYSGYLKNRGLWGEYAESNGGQYTAQNVAA